MSHSTLPLEANTFYHIYNHAVGSELLYNSTRNYFLFLSGIEKYLTGYIDIYSFCLMPNHFHLLIKIKSEEKTKTAYNNSLTKQTPQNIPSTFKIVGRRFSHLFNSYAQAYNKENMRKGSLFNNRYKRRLINSNEYLKKLIVYIHNNPVDANLSKNAGEWQFSSYHEIVSKRKTWVKREEVIKLFDNLDNFIYCHNARVL